MRVMIDREGGVDLDAITRATEAIMPILDASSIDDTLAGSYTLEVSSPGLERPLRRPEHFQGAIGSTVSIKFRSGDSPARRIRGVVDAAADDACDVLLDTGETEHVTYDDIVQARTVFEWGRNRNPASRRRARKPKQEREGSGTVMNSEMMEALENIEREKGISIEIMLEALANALLTAYKRMPDAAEEALVEIDMETGAIKVIAQELDEEGNVTREWDDTPERLRSHRRADCQAGDLPAHP